MLLYCYIWRVAVCGGKEQFHFFLVGGSMSGTRSIMHGVTAKYGLMTCVTSNHSGIKRFVRFVAPS
jgi:hypothetical protein